MNLTERSAADTLTGLEIGLQTAAVDCQIHGVIVTSELADWCCLTDEVMRMLQQLVTRRTTAVDL